jgi:hypothetical protein
MTPDPLTASAEPDKCVGAAAEAVWNYAADTAAHVFGGTLGSDLADRLLEELRAVHPEGLTRTKQSKLLSGHKSAADLMAARQHLIDAHVAIERDEPGEGRHPKVLYAVPPSKSAKEAKEAPPTDPSSAYFAAPHGNGRCREPGADDSDPWPTDEDYPAEGDGA